MLPGGDLASHEARGGHTIARHVGKSIPELRERIDSGAVVRASSFPDIATAERAIADAFEACRDEIGMWGAGTSAQRAFDHFVGWATGVVVETDEQRDALGVRIVLRRDASPPGYFILTAFPR
jgi:filamentous hemagglutinin